MRVSLEETALAIRVAINGFGRIGRLVFRVLAADRRFEVVHVNDLSDAATLAHLLRFDSTHGRYRGTVEVAEGRLVVDGRPVRISAEKDPANLPWKDERIDWVVESTGVFTKRADNEKHLAAGAARVLLTVPPKDAVDALVVLGVNEGAIRPEHRILSNASCTTNCLAPMAKVLHESFGIVRGFMNTIHAYTNDQRILDLVHKDLRRARSAAANIIPTTTGAARAVGKVMPALAGKLDGLAVRVPVPDGSIVDLTAILSKDVTVEEVNGAMRDAANGALKGVVEYSEDPLVSSDIVGNPASCVFDSKLTMASGNLVKVCGWYDNEWGYSSRVVDIMAYASSVAGVR
jgi:glyceraldehyde 3-phosphate dehydrogenase (phosphorylating)